MSERPETGKQQHNKGDKLQELVPPGRERVTQGQQFDELQRQQKKPDGSVQDEDESLG